MDSEYLIHRRHAACVLCFVLATVAASLDYPETRISEMNLLRWAAD
jgi:hypothetical protein